MAWNKCPHLVEPEWVRILFYIDIRSVQIGINDAIVLTGLLYRKVTGHQRVFCPVEQAGGQTILLTNGQPVPIRARDEVQETQRALLEEPQDLFFIGFSGPDGVWWNDTTDLRDEGILNRLYPPIDDRPGIIPIDDLVQLAEGLDLNFFHVNLNMTLTSFPHFLCPASPLNIIQAIQGNV